MPADRPYICLDYPKALNMLRSPLACPHDIDRVILLAEEFLVHRRLSPHRTEMIKDTLAAIQLRTGARGLIYQPWLETARAICRDIVATRQAEGGSSHHVYVILKLGFGRTGREPGLYIGETSLTPETRFTQHTQGGRLAAQGMPHRAVGLLRSYYGHLNPLPQHEAKQIEYRLASGLRKALGPQVARRIRGPSAPPNS